MENTVLIMRPVRSEDLADLQHISRQTFKETFEDVNTPENMLAYLNSALSLSQLTEEFNTAHSRFYFMLIDGKTIGYLKLNLGIDYSGDKNKQSMEIERIYLLKQWQGSGHGQVVFDEILEIARQYTFSNIWLGVWEHNQKAIAFYRRNSFFPFEQKIFKLGDDDQTDVLMKLELNKLYHDRS